MFVHYRNLFLFLILLTGSSTLAQNIPGRNTRNPAVKVKGIILDSINNTPIEYATVTISERSANSSFFTTSKKNGSFEISIRYQPGKYTILCSRLGYLSESKEIYIDKEDQEIDIGKWLLPVVNKNLKEVTITTHKSLIRQEIDKIIYDVSSDPEARSENLFDLIKKVPLISIASDDQILLKGSQNYKVLLDGKPSLLIVSNPKDIFKTMSAKLIEKIEIITVPPARFEAEGLAGIINIITNKQLRGSNGGVNAGYNRLYSLIGGNYAFREEKLGASVLGNIALERQPFSPFDNYRLGITSARSSTYESGYNKYSGKYGWANSLMSYDVNAQNLLTLTLAVNGRNSERTTETNSGIYNQAGDIDQQFNTTREFLNNETELEYGANYQKSFKKKKEELFTASYKHSSISADKDISAEIVNIFNYDNPSFRQMNKSGITENSIQTDFVYPIEKNLLEAGLKVVSRKNYSEYQSEKFDPKSDSYVFDEGNSNPFNYKQIIEGAYGAYYLKLKKLGIKTGVRLEQTITDAAFTTGNTLNDSYINLLPSITGTYIINKFTNAGIKFSRRLQRPAIWQLNPFVDQSNPKFVSSGNPDLLPVNFNDIEVSLSRFKKGSLYTSFTYSFANNTIQNVLLYQQDTITVSTYQNVGTNDNLSLNINFNYPLTKKTSINSNGKVSYAWTKGTFNGLEYQNEGFQGHAYLYMTYKFNKTRRITANGGFYSPSILLQGKSSAYFYSSVSLYQDILKSKGSLSFGLNNPFQKYRFTTNNFNTADFIQNSKNRNVYRTFSLNCNYRFGKIKELVKKNKRGINNDDIRRD